MSCSPFDIKDYFFGELPPQDRRATDLHLASCQKCQEELDSLNLTQHALLSVRDEEPPSRIAFVSDKVFAPRWYHTLWSSGPKMAFASSALLAAAILVHGFQVNRPASVPVAQIQVQPLIPESEVTARIEVAVRKAVAESEAKQASQLQQVLLHQHKLESDYKTDMQQVSETFRYLNRRIPPQNYRAASAVTGEVQ
jgi:anti-sigma factor RsiW